MKNQTSIKKYKPRDPGLYGSEIKLIAIICMILDHIGAGVVYFMPQVHDTTSFVYAIYWILRLIGRISFPIFCFFIVEGFQYTKDKRKYALRLFAFCLISEVPFDLSLFHSVVTFDHQNVFWTLLLGLLSMCALEYTKNNKLDYIPTWLIKIAGLLIPGCYFGYKSHAIIDKQFSVNINAYLFTAILTIIGIILIFVIVNRISIKKGTPKAIECCLFLIIISIAMFAADMLHTDYSGAGVLTIIVMYLFKTDYYRRMLTGCAILCALTNSAELVSFLAVPLIMKYNGKRGWKLKIAFYAVYPVHLFIIFLVTKYLLKLW